MWTGDDTLLVIYVVLGVALIVGLITSPLKVHPFLALLIGSTLVGLASGLGPDEVIESVKGGAGDVLGNVGLILALGTMLGKLMAESGGAERIAATLLDRSGPERVPWAMALIAFIVGIPLFFEIGVVLLIPIIFTMANRVKAQSSTTTAEGASPGAVMASSGKTVSTYLLVGIPALAGLSVLHGLVPPHPGPLIAIDAIGADIGTTLLYGLVIAVPTVIICGPLFARFISTRATASPPQDLVEQVAKDAKAENPPSFGITLFTILLPVGMMLARTVANITLDKDDKLLKWADFVGDPIVALTVAVLVGMYTFGFSRGFGGKKISEFLGQSLAPAAAILLIIGAGGAFKQVLIDSGIGDAIAKGAKTADISALVLAWGVAVLIRLATGSATIATITAAGIMAPLVASDPSIDKPLLVLAVGCGSLFLSHVNDAGFWLVNQYFGMSVKDTFKTWSLMETLISTVGFAFVLAASIVV
jgi:GntP family gluconate:H+ symporter